jgi:aspartate carbamoyltransferase catalytic subunit
MTKKNNALFRHLLSINSLDQQTIVTLLDKAEFYLKTEHKLYQDLSGHIITNLFFEPSTRTLNSFCIAANRLGAITLAPILSMSATLKGESLLDTIFTFEAMGTDVFIIRHSDNHTAEFIASEVTSHVSIINAGDGENQHPTQALLDLLTIRQHKKDFNNLKVAIIGDIVHSRVAKSLIQALNIMQTQEIRLIAPKSLLPENSESNINTYIYDNLQQGLSDVDVIVTLRIQKERMLETEFPNEEQFYQEYGLTVRSLSYAKPNVIVMHPGPMNRGIEIDSEVADGTHSVIRQQVTNGVAIRMAIMSYLNLSI